MNWKNYYNLFKYLNMKTWILLTMMVLVGFASLAQDDPGRREIVEERIKAQRAAFITQQLNLSAQEAEKFWPLYNEFKEKEKDLRDKYGPPMRARQDIDEKEAEKMIEDQFKLEGEILELRKDYTDKFLSALPASKVARLPMAEKAFHGEMLKQLRERRGMPGRDRQQKEKPRF